MDYVSALAGLATKALAEQLGNIGLVVDNNDAGAHATLPVVRLRKNWISTVRPSRQPLRGFLRMRTFFLRPSRTHLILRSA
jgi:hypothetical protein